MLASDTNISKNNCRNRDTADGSISSEFHRDPSIEANVNTNVYRKGQVSK
jgi:hypothetical protein